MAGTGRPRRSLDYTQLGERAASEVVRKDKSDDRGWSPWWVDPL